MYTQAMLILTHTRRSGYLRRDYIYHIHAMCAKYAKIKYIINFKLTNHYMFSIIDAENAQIIIQWRQRWGAGGAHALPLFKEWGQRPSL